MHNVNNNSRQDPFDVYITHYALAKLNHYAKEAQPTEIGGFARLQIDGEKVYVVDVEMIQQKSSAAFFEIESGDMADFTRNMVKDGRIDEVEEWCSIVHSHPVNMSPGMSGVDVQMLKDFAHEQDAFSLIISASHMADSKRLEMNYCADIRGRKVICAGMPVKVCTTVERYELSKRLVGCLERFFPEADENDKKSFQTLCDKFATDTLPGVLPSEIEAIKAEAKEMVPKLVSHRSTSYARYGVPNSNAWSNPNPTGFRNQSDMTTEKDSVGLPKVDPLRMTSADRAKWDLCIHLSNGYDPRSKSRNVTKAGKRKATERLQKLALKYKAAEPRKLREEKVVTTAKVWHPTPGDIVLVKADAVEKNTNQAADTEDLVYMMGMSTQPSLITEISEQSQAVIVDAFMFYPHELDLVLRAGEECDPELQAALNIDKYLLDKSARLSGNAPSKDLVVV